MPGFDNRALRYGLQVFNYAVFMALVWYFASAPAVRLIEDDQAVLTIAFSHAGELREPCRKLSQEELNALAPNMRKPEECPRERSPVTIEALLDDMVIYRESLDPPGLFGDGGVDVYFSTKIPAGVHRLSLKMNDSVRVDGYNHVLEQTISVGPARVMLIGLDSRRGFVLRNNEN